MFIFFALFFAMYVLCGAAIRVYTMKRPDDRFAQALMFIH